MTGTADVLVIGGGIAGVSAAARIAPDARVTVLEHEGAIGVHATGRSAAIFIANYGNATLRSLNAVSGPELEAPDFLDDTVLSPRGEMVVATEAELPDLERHLAEGTGVERLTPDEAVALVPVLRRELIHGAAIERDARDIDVDRLLQGFARLLRRHGGRIVTGAGAGRIERADGVWRVATAAGAFEAPVLVNAAGAWADTVAGLAGATPVGLVPMRRSAAILPAPPGHAVDRWPLFVSASESWYAKPEAGKLMVSPADEDPVEPHDAWPDDMVLAEGLDRFERMTTVEVTRVERSWAGLRSFVADRTPVVGFAPDADGFFWLAGQGGYGVQTSPALSRLAADLVLGRVPALPADVVAALHPGRPGLAA
ncbi:glycerol-3-phosphate dehydrogenase [Thalassobaculum fulvum]|uniref:Glycerol-3-phosphate dehydrogenase n=1 Tax=Thalassobaculum fulvum TaxID=1633335 RepID=A0A918XVT1_9PROT|nr:FAD-binding oxidoreductase [Thalassobaculum fulvum]GHD59920.1 glycerol-3-phosphate dehydrogenase [Thalassobaculum fulvum]